MERIGDRRGSTFGKGSHNNNEETKGREAKTGAPMGSVVPYTENEEVNDEYNREEYINQNQNCVFPAEYNEEINNEYEGHDEHMEGALEEVEIAQSDGLAQEEEF